MRHLLPLILPQERQDLPLPTPLPEMAVRPLSEEPLRPHPLFILPRTVHPNMQVQEDLQRLSPLEEIHSLERLLVSLLLVILLSPLWLLLGLHRFLLLLVLVRDIGRELPREIFGLKSY